MSACFISEMFGKLKLGKSVNAAIWQIISTLFLLSCYVKCKIFWIKAQLHTKVWDVNKILEQQLDIAEMCVLNHQKMSVITLNVKRKPWKYVNFFKKFAFQILQKMGWKWGQLCLGCLEGFCFCFDVWIQCCHNEHSSFILQKSHQEQMHEHFLNLWRRLINLKVAKSENLCILRSTTVTFSEKSTFIFLVQIFKLRKITKNLPFAN